MIDPPGHTDHARLLPALLRPCCSVLPVALLIGMLSLLVLPAAGQTTITVNSTADTAVPLDAHCTLREALTNANANTDTTANDCAAGTSTGIDTIVFNFVFGGPPRIKPGSALPVITDPVVIDGETFGDADCGSSIASRTLTVELDGSSSSGGSGLVLGSGSDGSTIRGLVIRQWPSSGVRISGSHNNTVACNFIGTDVTGTADLGNNLGVFIFDGATGNTIGGTTAGAGNLISGNNTEGVAISDSDNNTVAGNFIGTDATGSADLGNTYRGVSIGNGATSNTIGGTAAGARNVISGNSYGVHFEFSGNNNTVAGNFIGTDATGSADLGNTFNGVLIDHSTGNTIGGTTAGAGNVISGNNSSGVFIDDSDNNTVAGNFIGTDATGSADLGNSGTGVRLSFGTGNTIGGTAVGAGNVISGNNGHGVVIEDSDNNTVAGNFIGTDVTGTADLGNSKRGVYIDSGSGNTIGGEAAGAGNVISGNNFDGVFIDASSNNIVAGNFIGTDAGGSADLGNSGNGVHLFFGSGNTIGGTTAAARNVISGNNIDGIRIQDDNNTVAGNFIGTDAGGSADLGNSGNGVFVDSGTSNTIGGTTTTARNVISGNNESGVRIEGDNNTVEGNRIGTDLAGSADLGNTSSGVYIVSGTGNTIGGAAAGAGNVISGNGFWGVFISDNNNTVAGNFIGTDATGTADLGNTLLGVYLFGGATGNMIGGAAAGAGNVISGNNSSGVGIDDSDNNTVAGNLIGTDVTGSADLRNNGRGVIISTGASNNTIGGTAAGAGNTVAFNSDGIVLDPSVGTGNAIARNSLFENVQIGIDLGDDGLTPNDAGDGDTGPNRLQNTPILTAIIHSGNLLLTYSVDSDLTNATYPLTVEVFEADTDGEEGKTFLGSDTYTTTDRSVCGTPPCAKTVNLGAAGALEVLPGHALVTTATDGAGNTSEFSLSAFVYATRYVATTGNDTGNDCTNPGTPCATLAHAVSQANAGDTIDLEMGTYNASSVVIDKAVHILGAGVVVQ